MPPRQLLCRLTHTAGQIGCESLKILPQHSSLPKVLFHDRLIIQAAQCPLQPKTIPTVQDSNHIGFMPLHECTGYLVICRVGCTHAHPLYQRTDSVIWLRRSRAGVVVVKILTFGCGSVALRLLVEVVQWLFRVWKCVAKAIDLEKRRATGTVIF